MIKEDYVISILGIQKYEDDPSEDSEISVDTLGSYVKKGGSRYISYKEMDEEDQGVFHTSILKIEEDSTVTMMKAGTSTRLILEEGKRHNCIYATLMGSINLGVYTKKVRNTLGDNGGELEVDYTLDINTSMASTNKILVKVKPAQM